MDNTITALQNLYTALGGDADTVADLVTIPDMINAIAALITAGGGARLPEVSASDNGNVLKVVDGEWAVAAEAAELPEVGAEENGKVLTVVDGAWAAANLPAET